MTPNNNFQEGDVLQRNNSDNNVTAYRLSQWAVISFAYPH